MVETTEAIRIQLQFEADQAEKRAKRMERQLGTLERRFDPLSRATKRYEAGVKTLERALESGKIDIERYERNMASLGREFDAAKAKVSGAGTAVANFNTPASGMAGIMTRNRGVFQQAGYQIGDFAVQVQGGTSAITAFTQQGSQLLGVFGAYGAIAGAALAIGAPLIASFVNGGAEAEEYADVVDRLREAISGYVDAAELASMSTEDLAEKFGIAAEELRPTLELLAQLKQQTALNELTTAAAALSSEFQGLFENMSPVLQGGPMVSRTAQELENAAFAFGLTAGQGRELKAALDAIGTATSPEEVSARARELNNLLIATYGSLQDIPPEFQAVARAAAEADVDAAELQATIEETVFTTADLVATAHAIDFSNAIAGAQTMLGVLRAAYATAASLAAQRIRNGGRDGTEMASLAAQYEQYGRGRQAFDRAAAEQRYSPEFTNPGFASAPTTTRRRSGGGGGGGGGVSEEARAAQREMNELQREADRVIESLLTETQRYEQELARLSQMHEVGALTTDQFNRAQAALHEEMAQQAWEDTGLQSFVDDLANAIANAEDLGDVFVSQIRRMAAELISSGLTSLMQQAFAPTSGGGGGFGGFLSSVFGGFRADGGPVSKGKSYVVGERGPEMFTPGATGVITPNHALGGGGVNQTFHIDARGAQQGVAAEIEAAIRRAAPALKRDTLSAVPAYMTEHDRRMR